MMINFQSILHYNDSPTFLVDKSGWAERFSGLKWI